LQAGVTIAMAMQISPTQTRRITSNHTDEVVGRNQIRKAFCGNFPPQVKSI